MEQLRYQGVLEAGRFMLSADVALERPQKLRVYSSGHCEYSSSAEEERESICKAWLKLNLLPATLFHPPAW